MSEASFAMVAALISALVGAIVWLVKQRNEIRKLRQSMRPPAPSGDALGMPAAARESGEWFAVPVDEAPPSTRAAFESLGDLAREVGALKRRTATVEAHQAAIERDMVRGFARLSHPPRGQS